MALKVKTSYTGYDVLTCDDKNLIFSSDLDTYKIKKIIWFRVTVSGDSGATSVAHGLDYIPFVHGFIEDSQGRWQTDAALSPSSGDTQSWGDDCEIENFYVGADSTNIYIDVGGDDGTYNGKIIINEKII